MLTGKIRNDIDKLWEKFWTGGITNPLTVIEQISYLMFARMLDMQEDVAERKANRTGKPFDRLFPNTPEGQLLRWKNFRNMSGRELRKHLKQNVYPYFAKLGRKSDAVDGLGEDGSALEALGRIGETADIVILTNLQDSCRTHRMDQLAAFGIGNQGQMRELRQIWFAFHSADRLEHLNMAGGVGYMVFAAHNMRNFEIQIINDGT